MTNHEPTGGDLIPRAGSLADPNRRTRIAAEVDPRLREWLQRAARVHATLASVVRMFGDPTKCTGEYRERVVRGDRTVFHDWLTMALFDLQGITREVERDMEDTPPTNHQPGTPGKMAVLSHRVAIGKAVFNPRDAKGKWNLH